MNSEESKKISTNTQKDLTEDTEYIVPEPDGIKSGYPIDDDQGDSDAMHYSPESFNQRMRKNKISTKSADDLTDTTDFIDAKRGMSIKAKLISALGALTVVIVVIGLISYSSIRRVSFISDGIADNYSILAKISEQIKSTVYQIRDAEKDFLLIEEQEALDRATRYTERLRNQIKDAKNIGLAIEIKDGTKIDGKYENMFEAVEKYDALFVQQVKDIKQSRSNINANIEEAAESKKRLVSDANSNHDLLKILNENFWLDIQRRIKAKGEMDTEVQILYIGNLLNQLEKNMLQIQIQIARYLNDERKSNADTAKEYIKSAIELTHRIYRESDEEKIRTQIEKIRQNLNIYSSFFTEVMDTNSSASFNKKEIDRKIFEQKKGLKNEGDNLIDLASEISSNNWNNISTQTTSLSQISNKSQSFIIILVILGSILGILVLIYIPRPILSSIQQLLLGAQNVSAGNLSIPINISSRDELGQVAMAFENMRKSLLSLIDRIQRASVQISTSVNEIQAASNQQNSTANEQASAINEFNATMTEIARTSTNLARITTQVSQNTSNITQWINDSNNKSSQILESMNAINSSTKLTSDRIKSLNDKMDNINDAVITISGIADQTTLLSLNAAIEANKAGELGKGFAVVSTEIRRLSDRSIDSASSITSMVRDIQRATENSVVAMDKSSEEIRIGIDYVKESTETLAGINNSMDQVQDQITEISVSSKDQAESARQSQQTSSELLASSKMVAQASKQTSIAALELNAMANQLSDAVAAFNI
ncbi:membrane protein containing Chemotaxis methyl-accepting receptor, signaling domain protein [Candidatus Magnetomorum sp. HK-1]|nr:membrane protein containing Chemotaxis methyl-accepting receptor, signaling domain protein [Candidatus Magnetomorum sp. HK-1]